MALCHSVTGQCSVETDGWIELAVGHYCITLVCYGFDIPLVSAVDKILTDIAHHVVAVLQRFLFVLYMWL